MQKAIVILLLQTIFVIGCASDVEFEDFVPESVDSTTVVPKNGPSTEKNEQAVTNKTHQQQQVVVNESPSVNRQSEMAEPSQQQQPVIDAGETSNNEIESVAQIQSRPSEDSGEQGISLAIKQLTAQAVVVDFNDDAESFKPATKYNASLVTNDAPSEKTYQLAFQQQEYTSPLPMGLVPSMPEQKVQNQVEVIVIYDTSLSMQDQKSRNNKQLGLLVDHLFKSNLNWRLAIVSAEANSIFDVPGLNGELYYWSELKKNYIESTDDYLTAQLQWSDAIEALHMGICRNSMGGPRKTIGLARRHLPCIGSSEEPLQVLVNTFTSQYEKNKEFFREDSETLHVAIVTDEEESRSSRGRLNPENILSQFKASFHQSKSLQVDAVIIPPDDKLCMLSQWFWGVGGGHYSSSVDKVSKFTNGNSISLCAPDWSEQVSDSIALSTF